MSILSLLSLAKDQKERVAWAILALFCLSWTWNTASDVGQLKAQVQYQEQAIELMASQLQECK